ncbi:MAG: hypothetical protein CM1200mP26_26360 [Acidimicrobiales bacterium]|nr:MAG: hypothetical protein CM1200mP26_26360 [Acidimicrobiales bacterium]
MYLRTFDGRGIFAEHLAPEAPATGPEAVGVPVTVTLAQQVRGGIVTTVRPPAPSLSPVLGLITGSGFDDLSNLDEVSVT